jgi:hypothetical protein
MVVFLAGVLSHAVVMAALKINGINSKRFLFIVIPEEFVRAHFLVLHAGAGCHR